MPLPSGIRIIGEQRPGVLAWAWGLNGATSVLGATLAIHVAMSDGFARVATYGAFIYGCAGLIGLLMLTVRQSKTDTAARGSARGAMTVRS
jgi:hypothetical protein